jgi:hypothetical protein
LGLMGIAWMYLRHSPSRDLGLMITAIFFLGIPMQKALDSGNIDLIVAPLLGIALYLTLSKRHVYLLGIVLGILASSKATVLPFVVISLAFGGKRVWLSFLASYTVLVLTPRAYGVPSGLFDVLVAAKQGGDEFNLLRFTQVNYGNNALVPYVSQIVNGIIPAASLSLRTFVIQIISILTALFVLSPLIYIRKLPRNPVFFYTLAYVGILLFPAWTYDYRLLYALPILYAYMKECKTHDYLYFSILLLLLKSSWILKGRIMNIFLYISLYYLLKAVIPKK